MTVPTGAIEKNVRKSAIPMSTGLGGVCCIPSACRMKASTITIRVKEVIITRIEGASVSTVSSARIWGPARPLRRPGAAAVGAGVPLFLGYDVPAVTLEGADGDGRLLPALGKGPG